MNLDQEVQAHGQTPDARWTAAHFTHRCLDVGEEGGRAPVVAPPRRRRPARAPRLAARSRRVKTLVDLRDEDEKFGGYVGRRAAALGLQYISVPIRRDDITLGDAIKFYHVIYEKGSAPIYAFTRFGKRPPALILLLETVSRGEPLYKVYQRSSVFGLDLEGDMALKSFLVAFYNEHLLEPVAKNLAELRPDLFPKNP